jgi:hypothetical protein
VTLVHALSSILCTRINMVHSCNTVKHTTPARTQPDTTRPTHSLVGIMRKFLLFLALIVTTLRHYSPALLSGTTLRHPRVYRCCPPILLCFSPLLTSFSCSSTCSVFCPSPSSSSLRMRSSACALPCVSVSFARPSAAFLVP